MICLFIFVGPLSPHKIKQGLGSWLPRDIFSVRQSWPQLGAFYNSTIFGVYTGNQDEMGCICDAAEIAY